MMNVLTGNTLPLDTDLTCNARRLTAVLAGLPYPGLPGVVGWLSAEIADLQCESFDTSDLQATSVLYTSVCPELPALSLAIVPDLVTPVDSSEDGEDVPLTLQFRLGESVCFSMPVLAYAEAWQPAGFEPYSLSLFTLTHALFLAMASAQQVDAQLEESRVVISAFTSELQRTLPPVTDRLLIALVEETLLVQGDLSLTPLSGTEVFVRGTGFEPTLLLLVTTAAADPELPVLLISEHGYALIPRAVLDSCAELERLHLQREVLDMQSQFQLRSHGPYLNQLRSAVQYRMSTRT